MECIDEYITIGVLASRLNLPSRFLRELAERGLVPSLKVGARLRFDERAVREALLKLQRNRDAGGGNHAR